MSVRAKRPIKFRSLFKPEATEKDIQTDLRKMHGALQKIKMRRADKTEAVRGLRAAVLEYLSKNGHRAKMAPEMTPMCLGS